MSILASVLALLVQLLPMILKIAGVKDEQAETVIKIVPAAVKLVGVAEEAFAGVPKSGAQKAAMVNTALQTIVEGGQSVATGGAKATWSEIAPAVSTMVKTVADAVYNPPVVQEQNWG